MRNALLGYTYQHYVASLLLAKMDVEREIDKIVLEAPVEHKFDDIGLEISGEKYYLQIKDFENIELNSLAIKDHKVLINGKRHLLSTDINVIFFKKITYVPNCEIFGFPAFETSGVYIVSLNRNEIDKQISRLYSKDLQRKAIIEQYFSDQLDKRQFEFEKHRLPLIAVYNTKLIDKTVKVSRNLLKFKNILFIEGKPGIGKSHLVGFLQEEFKNTLLYRFWISNQDLNYEERLKYGNFLIDLSKKLFYDYKDHTEEEIIATLKKDGKTLIIDGLDHVENYNKKDLEHFIGFINEVQKSCKTIILSRPLQTVITWKKQTLTNWNEPQTRQVLKHRFHIEEYPALNRIYQVTGGYPILVNYIAQQYKRDGIIPPAEKFDSINDYYDSLLKAEKSKQALILFLCSRGFLMRSELQLFLDDYALAFVDEFVEERPYLFELRLNRISLFHDSLVTYLRKSGINYLRLQERVNQLFYESILSGNKRFQSRIGHFDLMPNQIKAIVQWYASLKNFRKLMKGVVDFEAIREFYQQLRNMLSAMDATDLETIAYYDLSLILNLIQRDHVSTIREFQYTYCQALSYNGFTEEDITSNKYLFAMWYYIKSNDASLLVNAASDDHYETDNFYARLDSELHKEKTFFEFQQKPFATKKIEQVLADTTALEYRKYLGYVLVNLYLHEANRAKFPDLFSAITSYMEGYEQEGIRLLIAAVGHDSIEYHQASYALSEVKKELLAYGIGPATNDYLILSLKQYLNKHGEKGSFTLWPEVQAYLRLSLHHRKKIDLASISRFWTKYYQRKDYSFFAFDRALTIFENKNWVTWQSSVKLITEIQEVSEKGYRGLLATYIMQHPPEFIHTILNEFKAKELQIDWFDLTPAYLDVVPIEIYRLEMTDKLRYHYNRQIPYDDIKHILASNKLDLLRRDLNLYRFRISVKKTNEELAFLKKLQLPYEIIEDRDHDTDKDPEKRFDQGILDLKNIGLIKKYKLSPAEVASMADGNYAALTRPELFQQFPKSRVRRDFREILFKAITGRSKHSEYHHVLWELPGTILQIMSDNHITIPKAIFKSFLSYLELSITKIEK